MHSEHVYGGLGAFRRGGGGADEHVHAQPGGAAAGVPGTVPEPVCAPAIPQCSELFSAALPEASKPNNRVLCQACCYGKAVIPGGQAAASQGAHMLLIPKTALCSFDGVHGTVCCVPEVANLCDNSSWRHAAADVPLHQQQWC